MSVPTRYNPKRLADYSIRGGRMKAGRGIMRSGPTAAQRTKASRDKYKAFIMNDIAQSDKRRKALETMWTAEQNKVTAERKSAVEDYKTVMDTAPDFSEDDTGEMRAAWENQPHVQAVKDRMKAHIQASLNTHRGAASMTVAPGSAEMGKAQHGGKFKPLAPKYRGGFDSTKPPESAPAPDVGEPPKEKPKQKEITVRLPNGSKGTVVGKTGNKIKVMDRRTRKVKEYTQDQLEILERRGLDPLTDMPA